MNTIEWIIFMFAALVWLGASIGLICLIGGDMAEDRWWTDDDELDDWEWSVDQWNEFNEAFKEWEGAS